MTIYYTKDELLDLGKTQEDFNGVLLNIYDRERTICDLFKYKLRIDSEIFNKSVVAYAQDANKIFLI